MKTTKTLIFLSIFFLTTHKNSEAQNCVQCDNTQPPPGNLASEIGINTTASSDGSFAGGYKSIASGFFSFAFGNQVTADGASSMAIGRFLHASTSPSMVIGCGVDNTNRLVNGIPNSLMVGFNSNRPTLFVSKSTSADSTGRIGIGNITQPAAKLHIKADPTENATLRLESTGAGRVSSIFFSNDHYISTGQNASIFFSTPVGKTFVFENGNVGIGTATPSEKLQVTGYTQTSSGYKVNSSIVISSNLDFAGRNGTFSGILNTKGIGNSSITGNLGIGTATPADKLHVTGSVRATAGFKINSNVVISQYLDFYGRNATFTENLIVGTTSNPSLLTLNGKLTTKSLQINNLNQQNPTSEIRDYILKSLDNEGNTIWAPQSSLDDGDWTKTGNNIVRPAGNTGIGCQEPLAMLQIGSGSNSVGIGRLEYSPEDLGYGTSYIGLNTKYTGGGFLCESNNYDNGGALIYSTIGGNLHFITLPSNGNQNRSLTTGQLAENRRMTITGDGRIGIGIPNPPAGFQLAVAGKILTEELTVELAGDWYDFVLEPDYPLLSINELESYINIHKHLPDIPTSSQIKNEGIRVGHINGMLVKKVEELTLYIVQLNKELTSQRKEIEKMKAEMMRDMPESE